MTDVCVVATREIDKCQSLINPLSIQISNKNQPDLVKLDEAIDYAEYIYNNTGLKSEWEDIKEEIINGNFLEISDQLFYLLEEYLFYFAYKGKNRVKVFIW
ncbi:MAG: hypothetical protein R3321_01550 [Nitrososphaeraceae archaeon]|nr:hypothetical protein [Nitrososphaeraceae archaeon]